ncbi:hypothetical protein K378_01427 [Streptomyces sp. Amel2xB2]|uniref:DUF6011 domain-containing protein n=1 Tax=Streptomyces sp. Amel2xB2 TaxID=1305829 RepID=UPI000DB9757C|nr:DUF6011 domain-containing protein [Streptomyces sp. Amel2xB2]RAJ70262.1 hypothetical protein K378_01427 [Streptomyces sp. Amel2xB2]
MNTTTEQVTCLGCRRPLRSAASIARGRGPVCDRRARQSAVDLRDFTPAQVDAARELIEDAAIVPLRGRVFRTVSTDGRELHLTHPATCNCAAGLKARRCYHIAAARLLLAA